MKRPHYFYGSITFISAAFLFLCVYLVLLICVVYLAAKAILRMMLNCVWLGAYFLLWFVGYLRSRVSVVSATLLLVLILLTAMAPKG